MSNIHIKLEYPEAVSIKTNMLLAEKELLESAVHIKNYNSLKVKEFNLKNQIKKEILSLNNAILALENHLPKEEAEEVMKEEVKALKTKKISLKKKPEDSTIEVRKSNVEQQIDEIREKLVKLGKSS
jgi:hypothetical protein